MNERIVAAQQAIEQILAGLNIKTVICIDDIYAVGGFSVELTIGWLSTAKSRGKTEDCGRLLAGVPLDASDDEVWKRALRARWERLTDGERKSIFDELAKALGYSADIERDMDSASLLRDLIPEDVSLQELGPAEWEQDKDAILDDEKGLLCLFDHNLEYVGYATDFGLSLLDKTIDARGDRPAVCGLLTHMVKEGEEISRGHQLADQISRKRKDFLVLSKDRLSDPVRFAHGLKMMSLNYARDFLTSRVREIATEADKHANDELMQVDVYNFDYMVLRSSEKEGVWEAETLFRLFEVLRRAAFRNEAFTPENRTALDDRIAQIRAIREVETVADEGEYPPDQEWGIRRLELYESGDFINKAHLPLELGDIFEVGERELILVAQPCDLIVRRNGRSLAEVLTLVNITSTGSGSSFALDYFDDKTGEKAYVKFRSSYHISADILDLAVFNSDGYCMFDASANAPSLLHVPWLNRFEEIRKKFRQYQGQLDELCQRFGNMNLTKPAKKYLEESLVGRITRSNLNVLLDYNNGVFRFRIRRIGRYGQPDAGRLLRSYFSFLSRYAGPHDYTPPEYLANGVWKCPTETESANVEYVGTNGSTRFHKCACQHARQISPERRICFESREAAIDYGREPCGMCRP